MILLLYSEFSPACTTVLNFIRESRLEGITNLAVDNPTVRSRVVKHYGVDRVPTILNFDVSVQKFSGVSECLAALKTALPPVEEEALVSPMFSGNAEEDTTVAKDTTQDVAKDTTVSEGGSILTAKSDGLLRTELSALDDEEAIDSISGSTELSAITDVVGSDTLKSSISEKVDGNDIVAQAKAMQQQRSVDDPSSTEDNPNQTPREWATRRDAT